MREVLATAEISRLVRERLTSWTHEAGLVYGSTRRDFRLAERIDLLPAAA